MIDFSIHPSYFQDSIFIFTATNREWKSRRRISPTDLGKSTSGALRIHSTGSWIRRRSYSTARSISFSKSSSPNAGSLASIRSLKRWYVVGLVWCVLLIAEFDFFFVFGVIHAGSGKSIGFGMEFHFVELGGPFVCKGLNSLEFFKVESY